MGNFGCGSGGGGGRMVESLRGVGISSWCMGRVGGSFFGRDG